MYDVTVDSTYIYLNNFFTTLLIVFIGVPACICFCCNPVIFIILIMFCAAFSIKDVFSTFFACNVRTFIEGDKITFVDLFDKKNVYSINDFDFLYDKEKDRIRCRPKNKSLHLLVYSGDSFGYESLKQYLIDHELLKVIQKKTKIKE